MDDDDKASVLTELPRYEANHPGYTGTLSPTPSYHTLPVTSASSSIGSTRRQSGFRAWIDQLKINATRKSLEEAVNSCNKAKLTNVLEDPKKRKWLDSKLLGDMLHQFIQRSFETPLPVDNLIPTLIDWGAPIDAVYFNPTITSKSSLYQGDNILHTALRFWRADIGEAVWSMVIKRGGVSVSVNATGLLGHTPLQIAIENDNSRMIEKLLHEGVQIDQPSIELAVQKGHLDTLILMSETKQASDDKVTFLADSLALAIAHERLDMAEKLLQRGVSPNSYTTMLSKRRPKYLDSVSKKSLVLYATVETAPKALDLLYSHGAKVSKAAHDIAKDLLTLDTEGEELSIEKLDVYFGLWLQETDEDTTDESFPGIESRLSDETIEKAAKVWENNKSLEERLDFAMKAHAKTSKTLGKDDQVTLDFLCQYGELSYQLGRMETAESTIMELMAHMNATEDKKSLEKLSIRALDTHACINLARGKLMEASELLSQNEASYRQLYGAKHVCTLNTSCALALVLWLQGQFLQAMEKMKTTMETAEQVYKDTETILIKCMYYSGLANQSQTPGAADDSEKLYLRAITSVEKAQTRCLLSIVMPIALLSELYRKEGRVAEAEAFERRSLKMYPRLIDHLKQAILHLQTIHYYYFEAKVKELLVQTEIIKSAGGRGSKLHTGNALKAV